MSDLISRAAQYADVIPRFRDFEERNEDCETCPFYGDECSGDGDKRCLSADILELLERGWENEHE